MEKTVREILDGNKDRFREIVRRYSPEFLRIAYSFAGNWEDAKDITQTTFIRTYRFLYRFRQEQAFEPWIFRIHLNNCKSAAHRLKLTRSRHVPLNPENLVSGDAADTDPASKFLLDQILHLSIKQKAAFMLVEIEGLPQKEAALRLGCRESTLRVHLARAKENLRKRLRAIGVKNES
ncbi:RNA polymerase sigma factor [bacterium]|nr:RNA polymerase sigma factor [bacterium]